MTEIRLLNERPMYDYRQFCKVTQGEEVTENWKPKNEVSYWTKQCLALHSTIRCLHFRIIDEVPRSVAMQLVRHTSGHPQPEVESSRPDWTGKERSTNPYELKKIIIDFTPESFLIMARKRLCNRTEGNTRKTVENWVHYMKDSEIPLLQAVAACSVPQCEYMGGYCPELKGCGKCASAFQRMTSE